MDRDARSRDCENQLSDGEIYAKLDFEYGLELVCDGLIDYEIIKIEAVLLNK